MPTAVTELDEVRLRLAGCRSIAPPADHCEQFRDGTDARDASELRAQTRCSEEVILPESILSSPWDATQGIAAPQPPEDDRADPASAACSWTR